MGNEVAVYETMIISAEEKEIILKRRERLRKVALAEKKLHQINKLVEEIQALGGYVKYDSKHYVHSNDLSVNTNSID